MHPLQKDVAEMVVVVQLVRTPDCGSGGRGFESHLPPTGKAFDDSQGLFYFPNRRKFISEEVGTIK